MDKILWKSGQMHLDDVKESFFRLKEKNNVVNIGEVVVLTNGSNSPVLFEREKERERERNNSKGSGNNRQERHKTSVNSVEKK